jgi:hypothetical protein
LVLFVALDTLAPHKCDEMHRYGVFGRIGPRRPALRATESTVTVHSRNPGPAACIESDENHRYATRQRQ